MAGILVTGGAGYIGSHVVRQLGERGEEPVVLDNLSSGFPEAVLAGQLVVGDAGDKQLVHRLLREHQVDTVMHFAAHTVVPESVSDPLKYYGNNTACTLNLLHACSEAGIPHFVFSSSAAVYGPASDTPISEDHPTHPVTPYGTSKLMSEWMLQDAAGAGGPRHAILRYFNVAGCDPQCRIGQSTPEATLLIKVACEAAAGSRRGVSIFGTDYPTPDGTGIRDFIHVEDLADAHLRALDHLREGGSSLTVNAGYGHGYSVREVLRAVERVSGQKLETFETDRRPGDLAQVVAAADRIRFQLGWQPRYDDLDFIVETALAWEQRCAQAKSPACSTG